MMKMFMHACCVVNPIAMTEKNTHKKEIKIKNILKTFSWIYAKFM